MDDVTPAHVFVFLSLSLNNADSREFTFSVLHSEGVNFANLAVHLKGYMVSSFLGTLGSSVFLVLRCFGGLLFVSCSLRIGFFRF